MNMAQRKAERCINPPEEGFLGSQQRHTREVLRGSEAANLGRGSDLRSPEFQDSGERRLTNLGPDIFQFKIQNCPTAPCAGCRILFVTDSFSCPRRIRKPSPCVISSKGTMKVGM